MTAPIDEEFLEAHAKTTQRQSSPYGYDRCPSCGPRDSLISHQWHGLRCRAQVGDGQCDCPGSGRAA